LRNLASEQIERLALALGAPEIEILHAEAGIAEARSQMRDRLDGDAGPAEEPGCPVGAAPAAPAPVCPVHARDGTAPDGDGAENGDTVPARTDYDHGLNEVSAPMVDMLGRRLTTAEAQGLGSGDAVA